MLKKAIEWGELWPGGYILNFSRIHRTTFSSYDKPQLMFKASHICKPLWDEVAQVKISFDKTIFGVIAVQEPDIGHTQKSAGFWARFFPKSGHSPGATETPPRRL